jgi:hypothetical protein
LPFIVFTSLIVEIFFCFAISAMSFTRALRTFELPMAMAAALFMFAGLIQYFALEVYCSVGVLLTL